MASNPEQDFVLKTIKSRDVHFVRFWFTDVLGSMKSFAVIPSELEDAFADGMGFDGSCIEGFCRTEESDMLAFPDASTFQVLPWRPESNAVARMFCGIRTLPESLGQAVELFRRSKLMRETLGDHICDYLVEAKQAEWDEYQSNVSTWELDRYLAVL